MHQINKKRIPNWKQFDCDVTYLAMEKCGDCEVPGGVGGHAKAEERPNTVIVERWYENGRGTTSTKYISPCPLV